MSDTGFGTKIADCIQIKLSFADEDGDIVAIATAFGDGSEKRIAAIDRRMIEDAVFWEDWLDALKGFIARKVALAAGGDPAEVKIVALPYPEIHL